LSSWVGEAKQGTWIPARAGIHRLGQALDARFRGHDMGWIEWDGNELSDGIAAGETASVGAVVDYAAVIPAFERVKESLFSLEGGHRAAMNE
jgi:hypothetical protein